MLVNGASRFHLSGWPGGSLHLEESCTHWGFVTESSATTVLVHDARYPLRSEMYFCLPHGGVVEGKGQGMIISQHDECGFFLIGGPIEEQGRLRYIDGCSDSLLIPPILKGDACLNLLHVPPRTNQTAHTHPSFRVGMVVRGTGTCRGDCGEQSLEPGTIFVIRRHARHSFHTTRRSLTIVAFHPDSDFGPTHEDHPMLNRTILTSNSMAAKSTSDGAGRP
ncbi:MAG: hypothetical protein CMJ18_13265 [Phycisphaeraceae bacterium]|nr:hypothetical protein [Phycisphaeraceae bacterium]